MQLDLVYEPNHTNVKTFVLLSLSVKGLSIVWYVDSTLMTQCAANSFGSNMDHFPTTRGVLAKKMITIILLQQMGIIPYKSTFRKCKYNRGEKFRTSTKSQRYWCCSQCASKKYICHNTDCKNIQYNIMVYVDLKKRLVLKSLITVVAFVEKSPFF